MRDEEGTITGLIGVSTDITEQVRANEAMLAVEQRFHALVEHAPIGICIADEGLAMKPPIPLLRRFSATRLWRCWAVA